MTPTQAQFKEWFQSTTLEFSQVIWESLLMTIQISHIKPDREKHFHK